MLFKEGDTNISIYETLDLKNEEDVGLFKDSMI